jgi:signal transduction histidine kinase
MPLFMSRKSFEKEVASRTAEACDQIISEMGAELHDDLIQKLSIFRLYIDRLGKSARQQAEVESLTIKMKNEFEKVIHVVWNISRRLLPARMEGNTLADTLEMLCQHMEHPGTGHIHFENQGTPTVIDAQTEMYLFRIVQELIHNAFKHSAAWHIWVKLSWHPEKIMIEVEDDGSGFAKIPEFIDRLKKKHNSLKMRTTAIGASIEYLQAKKGLMARVVYSFKK